MRNFLITGGSGSFGNAFTKRFLDCDLADRIAIYSRSEQLQEEMRRRFNDDARLRWFIGDVRDRDRLEMAMHGIDIVVHAAAMKIVPTAEYNPFECVQTNIYGAENVCRASLAAGVKRVLALSTDKAVNPVNLYGATKLAAEKIFIAANNISAGRTIYSVARYGNVVGSRGSVVPLFKNLAYTGKSLPITDPRMTRFWMSMDQAITLVDYALGAMQGREIFIPKIPSMRIIDLAKAIDPVIQQNIVGIRPGEKMHEILMTEDEASNALEGWNLYVINGHVGEPSLSNIKNPQCYASDTNSKFLSVDELKDML